MQPSKPFARPPQRDLGHDGARRSWLPAGWNPRIRCSDSGACSRPRSLSLGAPVGPRPARSHSAACSRVPEPSAPVFGHASPQARAAVRGSWQPRAGQSVYRALIGLAMGGLCGMPLGCDSKGDGATFCGEAEGDCALSCDDNCEPECMDVDGVCDIACGDKCSPECRDSIDSGPCNLECGDDCEPYCWIGERCNVWCGERCAARCSYIQSCDFEVGDASTVACLLDEYCVVQCLGSCRVDCTQSPVCQVTCAADDAVSCPDGSVGCGSGCDLTL